MRNLYASPTFVEFLTLPAYEAILAMERGKSEVEKVA
jgi:hypothetical protein